MRQAKQFVGNVASLLRYPVKSMQGEDLSSASFGETGLLGDRSWALVDAVDGTVVSAKNPKKWPGLLGFAAHYLGPPDRVRTPAPVRITCPDGSTVDSTDDDVHRRLSAALGRPVELRSVPPAAPFLQQMWPDERVTEEPLREHSFFDMGPVHLLTVCALRRLGRACPGSEFAESRFRPNLVLSSNSDWRGFVEQDWIGKTLLIGDWVRLRLTEPTQRCIMTTLPQGWLPEDRDILRTAARICGGNVGLYATVLRPGEVIDGDPVYLR